MKVVRNSLRQSWTIAKKELGIYFGSPMALIFVGTFLMVTLFAFFWVETFFARNIADVRPLFRWMPVLMIFLVAALTMRQWSEEQRSGTLEVMLTLPVYRVSLVLGKFVAVMVLVAVALGLTLFLPITVEILGDLDWGPVFGGYLAALLLAGAYAAIGLLMSSRTDNQIVALILTALVCGAFYMVGSQGITEFAGDAVAEALRAVGTGSRFESIERGVIDLRDLLYYLSLTILFLVLNIISLDSKRWSQGARTALYRRNALLGVALVGANLLALNLWIAPVRLLRADLTGQREYSLSPTTRDLIRSLQEPLLMRGYFSEKTHPLLAPLVPTIRDMMREYEISSRGRIKVEIVDPRENEEMEVEANQVYGIRPTPFRISGRYEDAIINSYFNILIRYGDQDVVLGFNDLIEVEPRGTEMDVRLRNIEYDLTRSIKKVVYGFQSLDAVLAQLEEPVYLTTLVTADRLPEELQEVPALVEQVAQEIQADAGGKFVYETVDPTDPEAKVRGQPVTVQSLYDDYGIRPFAASLFAADAYYYLHLLLEVGDEMQVIFPSGQVTQADLRNEMEAALKRVTPGFLKTVGLWHPSEEAVPDPFSGQAIPPISTWQMVRETLGQNYTLLPVDLTSGRVPGNVDVLVVVGPQGMTEVEKFAIDQHLMRGGALVVASGSYMLSPQQFGGGLMMQPVAGGLHEVLASYGVTIGEAMVMDPHNEPFPAQVPRQVGGMSVVEIKQLPFPFFVDVRRDAMAGESAIVANLPYVTMQWASPLEIDEGKTEGKEVTILFRSSSGSWLRTEIDATPDTQLYPELGFPVEGEQTARALAVSVRGSFESYFKDRPSPFQGAPEPAGPADPDDSGGQKEEEEPVLGTIESSPQSSRLVVIGSAEFLDDVVLNLSRDISQDRYQRNLQLVQNAVDWAVEDEDLLSIRSGGTYARLLTDLAKGDQSFWEGLNYAVALIGLVAIGVVWNVRQRSEEAMELV